MELFASTWKQVLHRVYTFYARTRMVHLGEHVTRDGGLCLLHA